MRTKLLAASLGAAFAFGASFVLMPRRGSAQEQAHTHRKGPRSMPLAASPAGRLVLGNLRFMNEADKATILFDVTNPTPSPVLAFTVRAGTYSVTPHGSPEQPALAPGATLTMSVATDMVADEAQLVLSAVRFVDGEEHGEADDLKLIDKTLKRAE
jgi:hypothetical protein